MNARYIAIIIAILADSFMNGIIAVVRPKGLR